MKSIKQFIICLVPGVFTGMLTFAQVDPGTVETYATDPALPIIDQSVTIYVNVSNWDITDTDSVTAYTGTITNESEDITGDWRNIKNTDWGDISLGMTKENDSVYSYTIADITAFYNVPAEETVFRITFIARGTNNGSVSGQTGNIYIEVFAQEPTDQMTYLPEDPVDEELLAVTWNINDTTDDDRTDHMIGYADTAYVHTTLHMASGSGVASGDLPDNSTKFMCYQVNDSIRRWYVLPTTREFFEFKVWSAVDSIEVFIHSEDGMLRTKAHYIPLESDMEVDLSQVDPLLLVPAYPTIDDKITIFIDAKNYIDPTEQQDPLNPASSLSVYTGLISSDSPDPIHGWQKVIPAQWGDLTIWMDRVNDSIHAWEISDMVETYGVENEEVFAIAFIARDTADNAVLSQTANTYFEIFIEDPTDYYSIYPSELHEDELAVFTVNINQSEDQSLVDFVADSGQYSVRSTAWAEFTTRDSLPRIWDQYVGYSNFKSVNDSVYRVYMMRNVREFFAIPELCNHPHTINLLLEDKQDIAQTSLISVSCDTNLVPTCEIIDIMEFESDPGIQVYPNPATNLVYIQINEALNEPATIELLDMNGQVILTDKIDAKSSQLDLSAYPKGVYLIVIRNDQFKETHRIIKVQ